MRLNARALCPAIGLSVALGVASMAQAAPVFDLSSGSLIVTAFVPTGGVPTYDIRGLALLAVSDTGLPSSPLLLFDSTGGTDPSATVLPFGNSVLIADDANTGTTGVQAIVFFDFGNVSFTPAFGLLVPATAGVFPAGSSPGPVLSTLTNSPNVFSFDLIQNVTVTNGLVFQWQLSPSSTSAPEPLQSLLMGTGLAALCALRSYRKRAPNA